MSPAQGDGLEKEAQWSSEVETETSVKQMSDLSAGTARI